MLKLKIRETVLNACDTLSANDPYKRRPCRACREFKTMTGNVTHIKNRKTVLTQEKIQLDYDELNL